MNYTCLIYGGVMSFAIFWYAIDARKWFKGLPTNFHLFQIQLIFWPGPRINVEHIIHGTDIEDQEPPAVECLPSKEKQLL